MKKYILKMLCLIFSGLLLTAMQGKDGAVKTSSLKLSELAGQQLLELKNCNSCHSAGEETNVPIKSNRNDGWFKEHVSSESDVVLGKATSERRKRRFLKKEIAALYAYLFAASDEKKNAITSLPANVLKGAYLAYQNNCSGCHIIAGEGEARAPELTLVGDKQPEKSWHIANLENPQQFAPESSMPAFKDKLPKPALEALADYLLTLKK